MTATAAIHALPAAEARLVEQANAVADLFAQTATTGLSAALGRAQAEATAAAARLRSAALYLGDLAGGLLAEVESLTAGLAQALAPCDSGGRTGPPFPQALPQAAPEPPSLGHADRGDEDGALDKDTRTPALSAADAWAQAAREEQESLPAGYYDETPRGGAADPSSTVLEAAVKKADEAPPGGTPRQAVGPPAADPDSWEKAIQEAEEEAAAGAAFPAGQGPPFDELPPVREAEPFPPRGRKRRKK